MSKRIVQFSIYRYDPDKDDAPYMQDISVELEADRPQAAGRADQAEGEGRHPVLSVVPAAKASAVPTP